MPVGADPGNWRASCRSAPVSPDTWTASPGCVPPPTAGPGGFFRPMGPISLRQYAGCEVGIRHRRRSRGRWDCHIPCPSTGFWAPSGRSTTMLSSVGLRSFVSWTLAPGTTTLSGPPAASTRMLILLPAFPRSVGLHPNGAPQNALSPWSNRPTAISQFTPSNYRHSSIRAAQMPSSTPRSTQCWKVRWIVLSSPSSRGKRFHRKELRIRKMTPSSILRAGGNFGAI